MAPRPRNNNAWLKKFIKQHGLTRPEIAHACEVNLSAVDRWLAPPRKVSHRKMPNIAVKLLMYMEAAGEFEKPTPAM